MKKPIWAPAQIAPRVSPRSERQKTIAITAAASANRTAKYMNTETSASASFTTTKVLPQISAVNPNARSARRRLLCMKKECKRRGQCQQAGTATFTSALGVRAARSSCAESRRTVNYWIVRENAGAGTDNQAACGKAAYNLRSYFAAKVL